MNENTSILIMGKINNGFKTKKDIVTGNYVSEESSLVKIKSKGLGLFYLESDEMTVEEIFAASKKTIGKYKIKEIVTDNIYNSVMIVGGKELRIMAIPSNELLKSSM